MTEQRAIEKHTGGRDTTEPGTHKDTLTMSEALRHQFLQHDLAKPVPPIHGEYLLQRQHALPFLNLNAEHKNQGQEMPIFADPHQEPDTIEITPKGIIHTNPKYKSPASEMPLLVPLNKDYRLFKNEHDFGAKYPKPSKDVTLLNETTHPKQPFFDSAYAIGGDIAQGAGKEIVQHPEHLAENALFGACIGLALNVIKPKIAMAAGAVFALYELGVNGGKWKHAADVVSNPLAYNANDQALAHKDLQGIGAGSVDLVAGSIAGVGSQIFSRALARAGSQTMAEFGSLSAADASMGGFPTPRVPRFELSRLGETKPTQSSGITRLQDLVAGGKITPTDMPGDFRYVQPKMTAIEVSRIYGLEVKATPTD